MTYKSNLEIATPKKVEVRKFIPRALLIFGVIFAFDLVTCRVPGAGYFKAKMMEVVVPWQLPLGTDYTKVVAFLDAHELEHSGHSRPEGTLPFPPLDAIVRSSSWTAFIVCDYQMTFNFDWKGKLISYEGERVLTGP